MCKKDRKIYMDKEVLFEKIKTLKENLSELKTSASRAKENISKVYTEQVKYLLTGISYLVTDIGQKVIAMNVGKVFNNVILELPLNARDVFVKLGETRIIPIEAVPNLKKLITSANKNTVDMEFVSKAIPSVEEFIFYINSFLKGTELYKESDEDRVI